MKRAKNLMVGKFTNKTGSFYPMNIWLKDNHGNNYQIFHRNKANYYKDIPLNSNDIGIIERGYFVKLFESHPFTLDFNIMLKKVLNSIEIKKMNLEKSSIELIEKWKLKMQYEASK